MGTPTARLDSLHPSLTRPTPASNDDFFDETQLAELRAYMAPIRRNRYIRTSITLAVDLVVTFGLDLAPRIDRALDGSGWVLRLLVIAVVVDLIGTAISAPFAAWLDLVHERRAGHSTITTATWVTDQAKEFVLGVLLTMALLVPVYAVLHRFELWWLFGGVLVVAVLALLSFVYPVLIMPRFNKFTPLPEGAIRTRVEEIAQLSGVQIQGVYLMDASKRTNRANAAVAGFGRTKRVILNDTICEYPLEELSQVIAHELGHYRLKHTVKSFPVAAVTFPLTFAFIEFVAGSDQVLRWAGVDSLGSPASVPLLGLALGIPMGLLGLAGTWQSRFHEREADLEALELLGDPTSFVGVWPRMVANDKANLEPTVLERLKASHPGPAQRMQFGLDWAEMNDVPVVRPLRGAIPEGAGRPTAAASG